MLPSSDDETWLGSRAWVGVDPWMGSDRGSEDSSWMGHRVAAEAANPTKTRSPQMLAM